MRGTVFVCALLAVGVVAQEPSANGNQIFDSKMAERTLKADVLRDNPRFCFGSTTFAFYQPGDSWELFPFCGKATCMKNETGFYEVVNDCGVQPKENKNCQVVNPQARAGFPDCCPKFECLPGTTLEYPTEAELKELIEKARQEQIAQEAQLRQEAIAAQEAAIAQGTAAASQGPQA